MKAYTYTNRLVSQALYTALAQDPFYQTLERESFPDRDKAREAMFRYYDFSLAEARNHGRLTLAPDKASGAAVWNRPLPRETAAAISEEKKDFIRAHLGQGSLEAYAAIVAYMSRRSADVVGEAFWYLSILGLSPDCQGNGMGRDLLAPVLAETDALEVPVYAESFTPRNFSFYNRLGFETIKMVREPVTGSEYAILVRQPGG